MNSKYTIADFPSKSRGLWFLAIAWSVVILTPLVPFPTPVALVGHPWKVEFAISFILCVSLAYYLFIAQGNKFDIPFSSKIVSFIIVPCCALIFWSAVSAFWAGSSLSVLHHTLVWAGYLIFFLFALFIVSNRKLFKISVISLGLVVTLICVCCIVEFTFSTYIYESFGFRYSRFAEIFAALLPLFFSFILRLKGKNLIWAISAVLLLWLGILSTLSRGALLTSVVGLFVFVLLRIFTQKSPLEKKRLVFAASGILLITFLIQAPSFLKTDIRQNESTFVRLVVNDEKEASNGISNNVRFLFIGVGLEMFSKNFLVGVGADNYGLEFNKYRAAFSAKPENKAIAEMQEWLLPERAHNEYLQILTELGIVGGIIFLFFIFGIAKLSFHEIKENRLNRSNILTHAALAGIVAFLASSFFSSFSFRLMQNGLVFFFLLAILLRNYAVKKPQEKKNVFFVPYRFKTAFVAISLAVCFSLTIFSALKATSQFLVYSAERQENLETAESYFQKAITLDAANSSASYSFGLRLLSEGFYPESAAQLQKAVDNGLNTSVSYSRLITAQTLANQKQSAIETASEAVDIFPYSVFMRVRYAILLNKANQENESARQFEIAERLDKKQAETWRLFISDGASKASQAARVDKEILSLMKLKPEQAVDAVLLEREIINPNEKMKFNF